MSAVTKLVGDATDWAQTPWVRSSLTSELKLVGDLTLEQAQEVSRNWARRSRELNNKGLRNEAIAAALKGLPEGLRDHQFDLFSQAHMALYSAVRANRARITPRDGNSNYHQRSNDGAIIATNVASPNGYTIEIWQAAPAKRLHTIPNGESTSNWQLSPDGGKIVVSTEPGRLSVWSTRDGRELRSFEEHSPGLNNSFDFSPNGQLLVSVDGQKNPLRVIDLTNGQVVLSASRGRARAWFGAATFEFGGSYSAAFANDRLLCVSARTRAGTLVGTVDVSTGQARRFGRIPLGAQPQVWCQRDGSRALVYSNPDNNTAQANVYQLTLMSSAGQKKELQLPQVGGIYHADFSPNGHVVAVFTRSRRTLYFDTNSGEQIQSPFEEPGYVGGYNWVATSSRGDATSPIPISIPQSEGTRWARTPTRSPLVRKATERLPDALLTQIYKERIDYNAE